MITMALLVALRIFPFTPRYIIPAAGMMVGNAMTVTGVAMRKFREDVKIQKNLVSSKPPHNLFIISFLALPFSLSTLHNNDFHLSFTLDH
jgi:putative ABC transport system permease protein